VLRLVFKDSWEAELASKAIEPDNYPLPRGLRLEMRRSGREVFIRIECKRSIPSLLTTIDDILSMMLLALRVSSSVTLD